MSLIDEALKRARQEASRQEAAEREKRYARVPVYVPPARRTRPWLLPAVVAACLAVGVAGGIALSRRAESPQPQPQVASATPLPAPEPGKVQEPQRPDANKPAEKVAKKTVEQPPVIEEKEEPPPKPTPAPEKAPEAKGPEKIALSQPPSPTPAVTPSPVIALPQPPPAPTPAPREEPAAPAPQTPPAATSSAAEAHSYVREVPIPGGGTLRLNGIAFSSQPVALFGDKVVAPGESLSGFTVVAVEAQRVKLQGPGGTVVYVTLK